MNIGKDEEIAPVKDSLFLNLADRWILSRLSTVASEVNKSLEEYRFNDSASLLYQFVWHEFCDWYLEMIKPALSGKDENSRKAAVSTLVHVFEATLGLLHPFIPFVTEELWQYLPIGNKTESLCIRRFPTKADGIEDKDAEYKMGLIMDAVSGIRNIRGELNLPPSLELNVTIKTPDKTTDILNENISYLSKLAKTANIEIGHEVRKPEDAAVSINPGMEIFVPLKGLFNVEAEVKRLNKEINKIEGTRAFIQRKLANENFINKAPKAVVDENMYKYQEYKEKIQAIQDRVKKLRQWGK
ncbi:MAG: class I tRNA ligase family protein [Candidatus Mariimomonas ferrooxydans]